MKKSIITILAAVAMLGAMTGCKDLTGKSGDISEKSKAWKSQKTEKQESLGTYASVAVELDKYEANWFCWTDEQGRVFNVTGVDQPIDGKDYKVFAFTEVDSKVKYVLYIGFGNYTGKLEEGFTTSNTDFRGSVTVKPGYVTTIKASNFSEIIKTVGVLPIKNNEPTSTSLYTNGDYTITEIWPLEPKDESKTGVDQKYRVKAAMRYQDLTVEKGQTIKVLFPAGEDILLGVYQPNRNKKSDGTDATCKYASYDDVSSKVKGEWNNPANLADFLDTNIHSMFATTVKLTRHTQYTTVNSYDITDARFNYKAGKDDLIRTKTADGEEIIEEIVEVKTGSFEK